MKKVIIVGTGAQGNVISGILAKAPEVSKIMLVDLDVERASEVAQYIAQSIALHEETLPRLLLPPDSIRGGSTVAVASNRPNWVKFA